MKLEQITFPIHNSLLIDYNNDKQIISDFFPRNNSQESFEMRATFLREHAVRRTELVEVIRSYMQKFGVSKKADQHLRELEEGAVAVVGGQQAGLLTGPLYSVHKAITVILLAKEQREKLGVPVVPVFWIAGEDHDLEEINHTYYEVNGRLVKHVYSERSNKKTMASTTLLNKEIVHTFMEQLFQQYGESAYTEQILAKLHDLLEKSGTFTDFFSQIMTWFFEQEGLLLIDAADPKLRAYESTYFEQLIIHAEEIAHLVVDKELALQQAGYGMPINATREAANLFLVRDGERFLLERRDGYFVNASAGIALTKDELLEIAQQHPDQLSNNVVTRPLMQEMVFPVLAFVGGPGELAYWATLSDAFKQLKLEMPIFVPRMNITIIDRQVEQLLQEHDLSIKQVLSGELTELQQAYISEIQDDYANDSIGNMAAQLQEQYAMLEEHLKSQHVHLDKIVQKNLTFHLNQLDFLKAKIQESILLKHDVAIKKFQRMEGQVVPEGTLQERVYNPLQYLNLYGPTLIQDLLELPFELNNQHKVVYL